MVDNLKAGDLTDRRPARVPHILAHACARYNRGAAGERSSDYSLLRAVRLLPTLELDSDLGGLDVEGLCRGAAGAAQLLQLLQHIFPVAELPKYRMLAVCNGEASEGEKQYLSEEQRGGRHVRNE